MGILGGTGPAGRGVALRLAEAGVRVTIGSRDEERAAGVVADLMARWRAARDTGTPFPPEEQAELEAAAKRSAALGRQPAP